MNKLQIWFRSLRQKLGLSQTDSPPQVEAVSNSPTPATKIARKEGARPLHGYSLRLIQAGADKEDIIHFLQEYSGMSLAETRALVNSAPCQVLKGLDPHTGHAVLKKIEMMGATCELVSGIAATPDLAVRTPGPYDVILIAAGPNEAQVIQMLRDLLDKANIAAAEQLVKVTPKRLLTHISEETAVTIKQIWKMPGQPSSLSIQMMR
jgi:ribosomal protein L7/L12